MTDDRHPFADLGLHPAIVEVVKGVGYVEPTDIQREAIPAVLAGRDVLGMAQPGTGKAAACPLPRVPR